VRDSLLPGVSALVRARLLRLLLAVMLFGGLAPAVSSALAESAGVAWGDVCSASGSAPAQAPADAPAATLDHCGYCLLQQAACVLPTPLAAPGPGPAAHAAPLALPGPGWVPVQPRAAHRSRAPPARA